MTEKSSDDIINELLHSLNLPPLSEKPLDKSIHKKQKREHSVNSNTSCSDSCSEKKHKLNGNDVEKRKHHKSKKKKKHKNKKQKHSKSEHKHKKEKDSFRHYIEIKTSLENEDHNDEDVKKKNDTLKLCSIKLPHPQYEDDCQLIGENKLPISEVILIDDTPLPATVAEEKKVIVQEICNKALCSVDAIPLPIPSANLKPVVDSSLKEIQTSQVHGKGKPIIIKNLKDSLVLTLVEEAKKDIEVESIGLEKAATIPVDDNKNTETIVEDGEDLPSAKEEVEGKEMPKLSGRTSHREKKYRKQSTRSRERSSSDREIKFKKQSRRSKETSSSDREIKSIKRRSRDTSSSDREIKSRKRSRKSRERSSIDREIKYRKRSRKSRDRSSSDREKYSKRSNERLKSKEGRSTRREERSSRSGKRYHSSSRDKSRSDYRSASRSKHKSPSRYKHRRTPVLSGETADTEQKSLKDTKIEKEVSPDCVDLLRDKAMRRKLLEVAKKNAVYMMKNDHFTISTGNGKPSGKSVEELTNFCKQLASRSDNDESDEYEEFDSESDSTAKLFSSTRHPFLVKDKPIFMNIRNAPMIKPKSNAERLVDQSKLREQFPVSSGSLHRNKAEIGWVAVEKDEKKDEAVFPEQSQDINISELVSTRLSAMRKLQSDPNNPDAMVALSSSQKIMQDWALSKQVPGQFTGTTGARILSQQELASGHQAWARGEQFREANPVSSHFGLKMLQKMGWSPGEGLGKHKEGTIEPLLLDVKMDKKGLHAQEEVTSRKVPIPLAKNLAGKHPVSALVELCSKRKWGPPEFQIIFDSGPDHKKNFLMKVIVNNKEYKPSIATSTKKIAKANAAAACLQALGVLPKESTIAVQMQPSTVPSPFQINSQGVTLEEMQELSPALIPTPDGRPPEGYA